MLEVYWGSGSPFAWRVLLALEVKKIPYVSHLMEFSKGDHKKPEFLALSPRGKVPAIRDGDFALAESTAILAYLERKHPEPPLFGRTAEETGRIWQSVSETLSYLEPVSIRIVRPIFLDRADGAAEDIRTGLELLDRELTLMESRLTRSQWLAGALSAADIIAYPLIETLLRAAGKEAAKPFAMSFLPLGRRYPALAAWRDRIMALPGYERTYPAHWREAPQPAATS